MNLGNYIRQLLPEHDTVIIPGLGAFISHYKPAQVNEKTRELMPPSKEVTFEPGIRNNDGLLAGKIAQEEDIPFTEANRLLDAECEELLYQLDRGEKANLEGVGELYYDQERKIHFTAAGKDFMLLDAYGLEATSLEEEQEQVGDEKPELQKTEDPFKEEASAVYTGASLRDGGTPPSGRKRLWWLLLFLIPLLAAAIYIITRDTQAPPESVEVKVEEPAPSGVTSPADTAAADTVQVQDEEATAAVSEITDSSGFITPDTSKYYLIRGSFEDFENANKYFNRLKNEGYKPFHLGKHGSFYLVGIDVYDNPIIAYGQQYNYLDKYPESGVWIFIPGKKYNLSAGVNPSGENAQDSISN